MSRHLPLLTLLFLASTLFAQPLPTPEGWNDLECFSFNKLQPHTLVIPYGDLESLSQLDYLHSPYCRSLNGTWSFCYYDRPDLVPDSLVTEKFPLDSTARITVPGNIELQGFGTPVYVNTRNEFRSNPPYAPTDYNPIGCYLRDFQVPAEWEGRRVIIKFGAVSSALALYVNGRYVGYSEDSKTPAEWDITRYLHAGDNRLVAKVFRWSDGSYMECQDMWRMSGITRDVALYSLPRTYISDYRAVASLDTTDYRTARLDLTIDFSTQVTQPMSVQVELLRDDTSLFQTKKALDYKDWYLFFSPKECPIGAVEPWTPDHPVLYDLAIRLLDANDSLLELVGGKIGFRNVVIRQGLLCLNGEPLTIRGVNRHEHSGFTGQYVTRELMRQDIQLMKQLGINAVRTSHYPDDEHWYELCDAQGILVWDEANNESHAQGYGAGSLAKNEDWADVILYRCNNMLQRDKNHPSVIVWSLGNECGNGVCFEQAYRFMKQKDATRPVFYERAELDWNTDIVGIMYPSVDYLSQYARGGLDSLDHRKSRAHRPYIMAEYCHAMGNSMGGLSDYWDTINRYPCLQGGFLWDWVDQSFVINPGSNQQWYAVGGDLGALPGLRDDDAFCANGLYSSDRLPHPHVDEVKAVYSGHYIPDAPAVLYPQISLDSGAVVPLSIARGKVSLMLHNDRLLLDIDSRDGSITQYTLDGQPLLAAPIRWNFWRPPTLNDLVDPNGAPAWEGLDDLRCTPLDCTVQRTPTGCTEVQFLLRLTSSEGQSMLLRQLVEVTPNGALQLSYHLEPMGGWRTLPKMGIQLGIDDALMQQITYYGNQYETYPDRNRAHHYALWDLPARHLLAHQHVVPQESGNHQADWLTFGNDSIRLLILHDGGDEPFYFTLRHQDDSVITRARRICDLHDAGHYVLSLDHRQAGLGTATCGPGVRSPYILSGDSVYDYRFSISPCAPGGPNAAPLLAANPVAYTPIPAQPLARNLVASLSAPAPDAPYGAGFPMTLYDGSSAVAGDYSRGWIGYAGSDSILLQVELAEPLSGGDITIGFCHHPDAWVIAPQCVKMQWSKDGKSWSTWQRLAPTRPLADEQSGMRHITYARHFEAKEIKKARHLRIRIQSQSKLPSWHESKGAPAWLMIDELRVSAATH